MKKIVSGIDVTKIKSKCESGMRVKLMGMDDPQAPPVGAEGTI